MKTFEIRIFWPNPLSHLLRTALIVFWYQNYNNIQSTSCECTRKNWIGIWILKPQFLKKKIFFCWEWEEGHTKRKRKNCSNWFERTFGQRILKKVCPSMRLNYQHSEQNWNKWDQIKMTNIIWDWILELKK